MASISAVQPVLPTPTAGQDETGRYVRKTVTDEVLVAGDPRRISETEHLVPAQWPGTHPFYRTRSGAHSPLLFAETVRQGLTLLSHHAFGVPLQHRIGLEHIRVTADPAALAADGRPSRVDLHATHTRITRRRTGVGHFTAEVEASRDGICLGSATVAYVTLPGPIYDRLRGPYADARAAFARALRPAPPVDPSLVGRTGAHDVVIAPTDDPHRWQLRTDTTHPVLFDHPHDHVPGMVLLEAFSQAAQAVAAPHRVLPVAFDAGFRQYVEFDRPCWITAEPRGRGELTLRAIQDDSVIASAEIGTVPGA